MKNSKLLMTLFGFLLFSSLAFSSSITIDVYREDGITAMYCDPCFLTITNQTATTNWAWYGGDTNNSIVVSTGGSGSVTVKADLLSINGSLVNTTVDLTTDKTLAYPIPEAKINGNLLVINASNLYPSLNIDQFVIVENNYKKLGYTSSILAQYTETPAPTEYTVYDTILIGCGSLVTPQIATAVKNSGADVVACVDSTKNRNLIGLTMDYTIDKKFLFYTTGGDSHRRLFIGDNQYFAWNSTYNDTESEYEFVDEFSFVGASSNVNRTIFFTNITGATFVKSTERLAPYEKESGTKVNTTENLPMYWTLTVDSRNAVYVPTVSWNGTSIYFTPHHWPRNVFVGFSLGAIGYLPTGETSVTFEALEGIQGLSEENKSCFTNLPVNNVTCVINEIECTTSSGNSTVLNVSFSPVTQEFTIGFRNGSNSLPPIEIPFRFQVKGSIPETSTNNIIYNSYLIYDIGSLTKVNPDSILFTHELSQTGQMYKLIYAYCEDMPDNNALNMIVDIWLGHNSTHYKEFNFGCFGKSDFYSDEGYKLISDVPVLNNNFNIQGISNGGTATYGSPSIQEDYRVRLGYERNETIPITLDYAENFIWKNNIAHFWLNQSIEKTWNNFKDSSGDIFTHFDQVSYISYTYNITGRSICEIGDIPNGNYTYSCFAPENYVFSDNGQTVLIKNISIPPYTNIRVDMSRIRPLSVELIVKDNNNNPVVDARCEAPYSVNNTDSSGSCILKNIPPNTQFNVTILPTSNNLPTVSVGVESGDYYNSQEVGTYGYRNACLDFDGIFSFQVPIEEMGRTKTLRFIVYDEDIDPSELQSAFEGLFNNQQLFQETFLRNFGFYEAHYNNIREILQSYTVQGATISIDNDPNYACVTNAQGTCSISWTPDLINHYLFSNKRPMYLDYSEKLPLNSFNGWTVYLRRNSTWWADCENLGTCGGARGDVSPFGALFGILFSPFFLAVIISAGAGVGATYYSGGNFLVGGFTFLGVFFVMSVAGLIPFWVGIVFVILAGSLLAFFIKGGFTGGI